VLTTRKEELLAEGSLVATRVELDSSSLFYLDPESPTKASNLPTLNIASPIDFVPSPTPPSENQSFESVSLAASQHLPVLLGATLQGAK